MFRVRVTGLFGASFCVFWEPVTGGEVRWCFVFGERCDCGVDVSLPFLPMMYPIDASRERIFYLLVRGQDEVEEKEKRLHSYQVRFLYSRDIASQVLERT